MKKLIALVLALVMVLSMAVSAFAVGSPEPCDHDLDANGRCSRCGITVISYGDNEANPSTGAPVFVGAAVLAAAALLSFKRK